MGYQSARTVSSRRRRDSRPPLGLSARYQAGATVRDLAVAYHLSVRAVRAFLVADGVQICRPGHRVRTSSVSATAAADRHPVRAGTAKLATVHPLHTPARDSEPQLGVDALFWPPCDLDLPHEPDAGQLVAADTPGQPCIGVTAPYVVHQVNEKPIPTKSGEYTAVLTRCARIGLVGAPLPPDAQLCAECHREPTTP
ncbi:hypothetical protein SAMN04489733_5719 [Amycolatopsis keratiniphila]|nr:hypothetical protein SAMN04489733_5719 [Amycolatopsis keratiniphila]